MVSSQDEQFPTPKVRAFMAGLFDAACRSTGLGSVELTETIRRVCGRQSLSRQTVLSWRKGDQDVPSIVLGATVFLAGRTLGELSAEVLAEQPELADAIALLATRVVGDWEPVGSIS